MKHITLFFLAICFNIICQAQCPKAAVYVSGDANQGDKDLFGSYIVNTITSSGRYTVMERSADFIRMLQQEMNYTLSGDVDKSEICQIGHKLGVDYVFVVILNKFTDTQHFASIRSINITTGMITGAKYSLFDIRNNTDISGNAQELGSALLSAQQPTSIAEKTAVYVTANNCISMSQAQLIESVYISRLVDFSQEMQLTFIERSKDFLRELRKEQNYQTSSGEVSDDEIRAVGKRLGVKSVFAIVPRKNRGEYDFNVRRIDVESQNIIGKSSSVQGRGDSNTGLINIAEQLAKAYIEDYSSKVYLAGEELFKAKDYEEAVIYFRKAAEMGFSKAQDMLGFCYEYAYGVSKDSSEAVKWYTKAAEQGYASAQYTLGCYYLWGWRGLTKDCSEGMRWLTKAAEQGYAAAQCFIGKRYYHGYDNIRRDYRQAFDWFSKAAEQGDSDGLYYLGLCYRNGKGVVKDKRKAADYFRKAAAQGHNKAKAELQALGYRY